jgi:hypothetical protein
MGALAQYFGYKYHNVALCYESSPTVANSAILKHCTNVRAPFYCSNLFTFLQNDKTQVKQCDTNFYMEQCFKTQDRTLNAECDTYISVVSVF